MGKKCKSILTMIAAYRSLELYPSREPIWIQKIWFFWRQQSQSRTRPCSSVLEAAFALISFCAQYQTAIEFFIIQVL